MNELVITREYAEAIFQMYGFVEHEGEVFHELELIF